MITLRKFKGLTVRAKKIGLIMLICLCTLFLVRWKYCIVSLGCSIQSHSYNLEEEWSVQYSAAVNFDSELSTDSSPSTENDKQVTSGNGVVLDYSGKKVYKQQLHYADNGVTLNRTVNVGHSIVTFPIKETIKDGMKRCSLALGVSARAVENYDSRMDKIATKANLFLDTLWEIIPRSFIPSFKNPCWYSNLTVRHRVADLLISKLDQGKNVLSGSDIDWLSSQLFDSESKHQGSLERLYCLPYFLLAGFAKSGTTTMHSVLLQHSHIAPPEVKEPHWWTRTPLGEMDHDFLKVAIIRYLINFSSASKTIEFNALKQKITYDGSTSMLPDSMFKVEQVDFCALVSVVSRVLPNIKLIVLIRDPVSRAYSQFYDMHGPFSKWPQEMKQNAPLYFHKYTTLAVNDFHNCLSQNKSDYECAHGVTTGRKELNTWVGLGVYYVHILKWMQFFPRDNFLFIRTNELSKDTQGVLNRVMAFLGLDTSSESTANLLFSKEKNVRQGFLNQNRFDMLAETKSLLEAFYSPYNAKLADIIGIMPMT